jgi:FKBP-type peptidyl-prolyl cis-trans isomerase
MKIRVLGVVVITALMALTACTEKEVDLSTDIKKESYANGHLLGENIKPQLEYLSQYKVDIDLAAMIQGLEDAVSSKNALSQEDVQKYYTQLQNRLVTALNGMRDKNKEDGAKFLAANAEKPGVVSLSSGLQYKVIKAGTGAQPKISDVVTVHYKGRFIDGTEFDSSHKHNKPVQFGLDQVISGWTEALQLMTVGSTWELVVPASLAYGDAGNGVIEPGKLLVFEIELLSIDQ